MLPQLLERIDVQSRELERVFEPFVQAEAVLTRRNGGRGLGPAIRRALTTTLGGTLEVESTPGAGSTLIFLLPHALPSRRYPPVPPSAPTPPRPRRAA